MRGHGWGFRVSGHRTDHIVIFRNAEIVRLPLPPSPSFEQGNLCEFWVFRVPYVLSEPRRGEHANNSTRVATKRIPPHSLRTCAALMRADSDTNPSGWGPRCRGEICLVGPAKRVRRASYVARAAITGEDLSTTRNILFFILQSAGRGVGVEYHNAK